ncbi:hypothetical protein KSD_30530 [Ktedonobacter sp. SOSP1-85]|uniref:protein phosphatase 2C domain-containing protein n=1 Tax=Ktedonobacter sp. SOSP1-85 TaxID=2778367 RepID=UPI001914DD48|nr:protein phosphatase 2C domain-containing protein [Ktedonobacter sp. SOSP1-85]GHO75282.1 hypothetical protein KSD_30530 [Ktedonobacter sp. SOSP1-85]
MLCPSCHTSNRANAKFCKGCGQVLPAEPAQEVAAPEAAPTPSDSPLDEKQATANGSAPPSQEASSSPAPEEDEDQFIEVVASGPASEEDLSQAPTQILSPEKMVEYQSRRWQQELERDHQGQAQPSHEGDIADAPTMMMSPVPKEISPDEAGAFAFTPEQQDISETPTVLMTPQESAALFSSTGEEYGTVPAYAQPGAFSESVTHEEDDRYGEEHAASAASPTGNAEVVMEQVTPPHDTHTTEQNQQELPTPAVPEQEPPQGAYTEAQAASTTGEATNEQEGPLAEGTLLNNRYEVAEQLADEEGSRLYRVVDHQGYKRCWNCGSTENTEEDDFCSECGANLQDATYTMREFLASSSGQADANLVHDAILDTFVANGHTYVIEQQQTLQSSFPNGVHVLAAGDSDAGNMRRSEPNEDSTLVLQLQRNHESFSTPLGLYIVADGMGGHDNGQLASRTAIRSISERMLHELLLASLSAEQAGQEAAHDEDSLVTLLHDAVEDANATICQANQQNKTDMGCTITGFMLVGDFAYILNVGDSRTYLLRDSKLYKLTTDHSLVGQLVAGGMIEPDEVYTHPQRNQIFRSLGDKLNVQIDIIKQQVHPGDVLLSCSDGLWEMVRDPQMEEILNNAPDPQTACSHLIETANINGGEDNVSAVVVFVR